MAFRYSILSILLVFSGSAAAIGLGELRGQPSLGESFTLEIDLLGAGKSDLEANCFQLVKPSGANDLPWLKKATISIRRASTPILQIRSDTPLREPALQLAVQISCRHEISRQYVILASPNKDTSPLLSPVRTPAAAAQAIAAPARRSVTPRRSITPSGRTSTRLVGRHAPRRSADNALQDRLVVQNGSGSGDTSLRLATDLQPLSGAPVSEAQREVLRLESRLATALQDRAANQLATAEKLRQMEATLGELQQKTADFARRLEKGGSPVDTQPAGVQLSTASSAVTETPKPTSVPAPIPAPIAVDTSHSAGLSEWHFYGVLLGVFVGLGGWLAWKNRSQGSQTLSEIGNRRVESEPEVDRPRPDEDMATGRGDLPKPAAAKPMAVDFDLGALDGKNPAPPIEPIAPAPDSVFSTSSAFLDEHFEASPVMELADIMLSFGRVKGAAQALQEYIDQNPQEALQPWIRLMEVYRMAGMRAEFEAIASNLNQNFNVEIQQWNDDLPTISADSADLVLAAEADTQVPLAPRPQCLEDMPRIMSSIVDLWPSKDVVGYLYELLRDNRGGKRVGFSLPVVEEILFLVELKETANRIE